MKKIFLILGFVATVSLCSAYPSEKVSPKVLLSFKTEFASAENVEWETSNTCYRAAFTLNGQRIFAFYSPDGDLVSVGRYLSSIQLPINLFNKLKNNFDKYWISDLFEINNNEGLHYYVTLETANTKLTMVSSNGGGWNIYSKSKKI